MKRSEKQKEKQELGHGYKSRSTFKESIGSLPEDGKVRNGKKKKKKSVPDLAKQNVRGSFLTN